MTDHDRYDFIVVANRLPVDLQTTPDGASSWARSPGGLVTALEPVMASTAGAWVGWSGSADVHLDPFDADGTRLVPVALSALEVEQYYEGFSNDTLWPLYHDVIEPPSFHREWWEAYGAVNRRFADTVARIAAPGATVWVHDYQLQLVPHVLRQQRPDLTIGYFHHIPFPPYGIYSQLPWRRAVVEGLLGADVIGFQRAADADNFLRAVRRLCGFSAKGAEVRVPDGEGGSRVTVVKAFPISIDVDAYEEIARRPEVQERARQIRADLGNPDTVFLGVDRLDYTKGIRHRLKAYGELLEGGALHVGDAVLVQVASPSRERVAAYMQLRDEIERTVGRLNGTHATMSHSAVAYLHHGFPREEMVALYLAADVMVVTALRDGMNLVAKEYAACRLDNSGVLVLSEFAGAADELKNALLVNPHDIEGLKEALLAAARMPRREQTTRMRALRRRVRENDVARWSGSFLATLRWGSTHSSGR